MHFTIIKQTIRALSLNYKQTSGVMVAIWQHSWQQFASFADAPSRCAFPVLALRVAAAAKPPGQAWRRGKGHRTGVSTTAIDSISGTS
jgi:hypothetical protein